MLPLIVLVPWTLVAAVLRFASPACTDRWFSPAVALTVCYLIGAAWLWRRGMRRVEEQSATTAADWPRCRLASWLLGVFLASLMTLWAIDMEIQQRALQLQAEARALALSVAPPMIPDAENAAIIYAQVIEVTENWNESERACLEEWWPTWLNPDAPQRDFRDPDLERFLQRHTVTLGLIREAAGLFDCSFDVSPCTRSFGLWRLDESARLLALSARRSSVCGDAPAAIADINALLGMAEHMSNESSVEFTADLDRRAFDALQDLLAGKNLSVDDLNGIRLHDTISYRNVFQRAVAQCEARGLRVFSDTPSQGILAFFTYCKPTIGHWPLVNSAYRVLFLEDDVRTFRDYCRAARAKMARPYSVDWKDGGLRFAGISIMPMGFFGRGLAGDIASWMDQCVVADARRRVARAALAAAKYQAAERELPESLEELVPDYLTAVLFDPFDGKPLRMKRTARGIVIYSIGPDGKDDGGQPLDEAEKTGDITFELPDRKQSAI